MENPKTSKVTAVFYKDNGKPLFELYDIEEISKKAGYNMPNNKFEKAWFSNFIRQVVYGIQRVEFNQNGRLLINVKIKRQPAIYGFTKNKEYLINYIKRLSNRMKNSRAKLQEKGAVAIAMLPAKEQLQLDL